MLNSREWTNQIRFADLKSTRETRGSFARTSGTATNQGNDYRVVRDSSSALQSADGHGLHQRPQGCQLRQAINSLHLPSPVADYRNEAPERGASICPCAALPLSMRSSASSKSVVSQQLGAAITHQCDALCIVKVAACNRSA